MSPVDFLMCFALSTGIAISMSYGNYILSAFLFMLFLTGCVGIIIHNIRMPQPRFIFVVKKEELEEEKQ